MTTPSPIKPATEVRAKQRVADESVVQQDHDAVGSRDSISPSSQLELPDSSELVRQPSPLKRQAVKQLNRRKSVAAVDWSPKRLRSGVKRTKSRKAKQLEEDGETVE